MMATITRGKRDELLEKIKRVLEEYEKQHQGARCELYRQNSASIRIRIVDESFADWTKGKRHDHVWKYLSSRLSDDDVQEISVLLLLTSAEKQSSMMDAEFDNPVPSQL